MVDLDPASRGQVERILGLYLPGTEVRLAGSRARGPAKRCADIDLLVMSDEPLSPLLRALLNNAFEESNIPFKVDVMEWQSLASSFRARLLLDSVPLVGHVAAA